MPDTRPYVRAVLKGLEWYEDRRGSRPQLFQRCDAPGSSRNKPETGLGRTQSVRTLPER